MARYLENDWFLLHEVVLLEWFGEVDLCTDSFGLNLLYLLLSVFFTVSHCD
jgi:hypothetical protein